MRVRELSARVTTLPAVGSLAALWADLTPLERREVLQGFLSRVEVARGASDDLARCVRIFWSDGSEVTHDESDVWAAAV